MLSLTRPTLQLFESWAEAVAEFGGMHIDGASLSDNAAADRATCEALVAKAQVQADVRVPLPDDFVRCDLYWMTDGPEVVGFIALRHELNAFLADIGGHIGYSVRPSRRALGHASSAVALTLERARELGLDQVMLSCDDDNVASARVIEGAGGVLADVRDRAEHGHPLLRRYWITL